MPNNNMRQNNVNNDNGESQQETHTKSYYSVCYALMILILLVIILGVSVAILIEITQAKADGDNHVSSSTLTPSSSSTIPTARPSQDSTTTIDCRPSRPLFFQSIAHQPGVRLLSGLQSFWVLGTNACEAIVHLPFAFPNLNQDYNDATISSSYTSLYVTPSGIVRFYKYGHATQHCASECAGIAIAKPGRVFESYHGDIWVLSNSNSLVVSWENVTFDQYYSNEYMWNAQLTLYENGNIQMCWGIGWFAEGTRIQATIWDYSLWGFPLEFPVTGDPFQGNTGMAHEEWPTNQCRIFDYQRREWMNDNCSHNKPPPTTPPPTGEYIYSTCEVPQVVSLDYYHPTGSLQDGVPHWASTKEEERRNPSWACPKFVQSYSRTQWYTVRGLDVIDDTTCLCVELRSLDAPFVLGVYWYATNEATCDDLRCVMDTDFTSESIVWWPSPEKYKLAVSLLRGTDEESLLGTYQLAIYKSQAYCRDLSVPGQASLLPGSCKDL